ncbi:DUF120 domain-containing protein [Caldiplasma sukawensis]
MVQMKTHHISEECKIYKILKTLIEVKAKQNKIRISSKELSKHLGISQQSASRYLIEMEKLQLIKRYVGTKNQEIEITDKGFSIIYKELETLKELLDLDHKISIRGTVFSGLGEGKYYISKSGYYNQFYDKLGIKCYPGTLNIKVLPTDEKYLREIREKPGIIIEGFSEENRTFGEVKALSCKINGIKCGAIFPVRSVYNDVVEIISGIYLREYLKINDGDELEIVFD